MTPTRILSRRIGPLIPFFLAPAALSQSVSLNGPGFYTQNFNTLPTATGTSWVNNVTLEGWTVQTDATPNPLAIGVYDGGSPVVNGFLSMGFAGNTDRAIGFRPTTASYGMTLLGVTMRNTASTPITIGHVEFTGELWRTQDTANNIDGYQVFYQIGSSAPGNLGPFTVNNGGTYAANAGFEDAGWTRIPQMEYAEANAVAASALVTPLTRVVGLNFMGVALEPGQFLTFRWRNPNDTAGDAVMGIDDFLLSHSVAGSSLVYNSSHGQGGGPNGVLTPSATTYWSNAGAPAGFAQGDSVTFSEDVTATIAVPTDALVSSMTVSAQAGVYTIGGAGRIESGALVKSGAGGLVLTSANAFGAVTLHDSGTIVAQAAGGLNSNTLALANGGTLEIGVDSTIFQAVTGTGPLTKTGAGVLRLGGGTTPNTYTGTTFVNAGALEAAKSAGTLGIPGNLVVEAGAAFVYGGNNRGHQIADSASVTINSGSFGDPVHTNPTNPGASETVTNVALNGGSFSTGRATFTANNEFTLTAGTLRAARGGILVVGNRLTLGGTLIMDGGSTTVGQSSRVIIGGGGLALNGATIQMNAGPSTLSGTSAGSIITLGGNIESTGNSTIARLNAATVVLSADIDFQGFDRTLSVTGNLTIGSNQAPVRITNGGIVKTGPGVLWLGGAQTYAQGTTVNGGKLFIDGSLTSTLVTVGAGATFGGNGTLTGALNVSNAGQLEPGLTGVGALTLASLRLGSVAGDTAAISIPVQAAPAIVVTNPNGLLANGGPNSVAINVQGAIPALGTHRIIDYDGVIGGTGFEAFKVGTLPNRVAATLMNDPDTTAILLNVTESDRPIWSGAVSSEWSTAALAQPKNWVLQTNAVPTDFLTNDYVIFADGGNPVVNISVEDVAPALTQFTNVVGSYTITGSKGIVGEGSLLIEGGGSITIENVNAFTGPVMLKAGVLIVDALSNSGVGGALGAGSSIVLDGGMLEVRGTNATGTNRAVTAGAGGGALIVAGQVTLSGGVSGTGALVKNGPGMLVLAGDNGGFNGRLEVTEGSVSFGGQAIGGSVMTIALDGGTLENTDTVETIFNDAGTILRALEVGASGGTLRVANAAGAISFQRTFGVSGFGTLRKTGPGVVRMQASNGGLAATWTLDEGVLEAGAADALGSGNVTVNAGLLATRNVTVNTPIIMKGGALGTRTGDLGDFAGPVSIEAPADVLLRSYSSPAQSRSLTISGLLSGAADLRIEGNLPETGNALIVTNTANTYGGTFRVAPGQFLTSQSFSPGNPLGSASVVLTDAGLNLRNDGFGDNGVISHPNGVTIAGTGISRISVGSAGGFVMGNTVELGRLTMGAQKLVVSGANQYRLAVSGQTTLTGHASFEPTTADLILQADVTGDFGITKSGPGRLILAAITSFKGPVNVQAGTFVLNGVTATGVDVAVSGGTFAGGGVVGGDLLFNGLSTFEPGDSLRGILQIDGDLNLDAATTAAFELANAAGVEPIAGNDYAQVRIGTGNSGAFALNNATLSLTIGLGIQENDLFFLFLNDAADPITGQFAGLDQGSLFVAGGQTFQISYTANDATQSFAGGNDIALQAVPEPGSIVMLGGGFFLCAAFRRRQRG